MESRRGLPETAAVFGASGGIGSALVDELLARGVSTVHAGSRSGASREHAKVCSFCFDLDDERSLEAAARKMGEVPPELVIVATGVLTLPEGQGPERSYKAVSAGYMARIMQLNAIGPALIAKHILPLFPRDRRSVFAAISARVGSIGDNRIGGWHSYRASKAALNMLLKNYAIELARTHPKALAVGLHPGTVDTALSAPFQSNLREGQLVSPEQSASDLLDVIAALGPADSGGVFAWDGERLPW